MIYNNLEIQFWLAKQFLFPSRKNLGVNNFGNNIFYCHRKKPNQIFRWVIFFEIF